jgi:hypothetical protein
MPIRVETYSGYSSDESPRRFQVAERMVEVVEIVERWRTPLESGFRVRAGDGKSYILRRRDGNDGESEWVADLVAGC